MLRELIPAHLIRQGDVIYLQERLAVSESVARLDGKGHRILVFISADGKSFERKWPEDSPEPWFDRVGQDCRPADLEGLRDFIHHYLEENWRL